MKIFWPLLILILSSPALASLKVVTTTPDLAWAVKQIGGEEVNVESLLRGTEDPHYVDAVPSFIVKVRAADLLCAVGLELEAGWLPKVRGRAGVLESPYCEFGRSIEALEKPKGPVDRSMGDVHSSGNPHFYLSPSYLVQGAGAALQELKKLRPEKSSFFDKRYEKFVERMNSFQNEISQKLEAVNERPFLQYHQEFTYFFKSYGFKSAGSLENIPGVSPSASRLAQLSLELKNQNVSLVLAARHAPLATLERFQSLSDIPFLRLPLGMIEGKHESYFDLQNELASEILKHAK